MKIVILKLFRVPGWAVVAGKELAEKARSFVSRIATFPATRDLYQAPRGSGCLTWYYALGK